jgi:hypothetical protein
MAEPAKRTSGGQGGLESQVAQARSLTRHISKLLDAVLESVALGVAAKVRRRGARLS